MLFIGKKPEKENNVLKIVLIVSGVVLSVAAIGFAAYKLYKKYVPACIDCECEDFLDDEDLFEEDDIEVSCQDPSEA